MPFRYSDQEWEKIVAELATQPYVEGYLKILSGTPRSYKTRPEELFDKYRTKFEATIEEFQKFTPKNRKATLKASEATTPVDAQAHEDAEFELLVGT